jgi:flagellar biosynthesis regulator FlaF
MQTMSEATRAYEAASTHRNQRQQEADVFRRAIGALKAARNGDAIRRVRALSDNRRLWITVSDLMRDPGNALPVELRASIMSVGLAVQREMDRDAPDFGFLIAVNENLAAGLDGGD